MQNYTFPVKQTSKKRPFLHLGSIKRIWQVYYMKTSIHLCRIYRAIYTIFFTFRQITIWFLYAMYILCICFLYHFYMLPISFLYASYMVEIWWRYGRDMVEIWWVYGGFMVGLWWVYGVICWFRLSLLCPATGLRWRGNNLLSVGSRSANGGRTYSGGTWELLQCYYGGRQSLSKRWVKGK